MGSLGIYAQVVVMNEAGEVVGITMTAGDEQHIFFWSEARGMVDLGTGPHGFTGAWAVDINARGDIIGYTAPCPERYAPPNPPICGYPQHETRAILWRKQ